MPPLAFNPGSGTAVNSEVRWKLQAKDYTAEAGDRILVDTSSGAWALTLPQAQVGDEIDLFGIAGLETNHLNINLGETKFENQALVSLKLVKNDYVKLVYAGATIGWMASNKFNLEITRVNLQLLLDKYPGAALAYSLRKLKKDYQGLFIDGLDVSTWMDQSGNNGNALQADATRQPRLIENGINAKQGLSFDRDYAMLTIPEITTHNFSVFAVLQRYKATAKRYEGILATSTFMLLARVSSGEWGTYGSSDQPANSILEDNKPYLLEMHASNRVGEFFSNNTLYGGFNLTTGQYGHIGGLPGQSCPMILSEVLIYPFDARPSRAEIATDIMAYYQIQ